MVLPDGRIKLMDFGAARDYTKFGKKSLSIVLKPGYAPPEQYQTHGVQGPWTDIYALCATMYKCITGENPPDAIGRVMEDRLKKISELGISVSPQIEKAIMKGMRVAAQDRYHNIGDFCEDLYGGYEKKGVAEVQERQMKLEITEKEKVSIPPEKERISDNREKEEPKKIQKKNNYFLPIIGILILLGMTGIFAYNKSVAQKRATAKVESSSQEEDKDTEYKIGETIEFGNYPQEEDGTEKPIEWIVMKNEGNQVLLLSKYVLDAKPYNEEWEDVTWETSDIRKWLNNEFYTTAFNKAEKAKIQTSLIKNEDNSEYGTSGGNDTEDKVFLLSQKEAKTLFSNREERIAKATGYAHQKSGLSVVEKKESLWWLRSPGSSSYYAAEVNDNGWVNSGGYYVHDDDDGVRPALYLNLQS